MTSPQRIIALISPLLHTSTTARPRSSTPCSVKAACSAPDQHVDDRIMDSMELERERGITIAAKNCASPGTCAHQHHRYPRTRRFRRRSGTGPVHGRRRHSSGRRLRRPPAPDPFCSAQGPGTRPPPSLSSSTRSTARTRGRKKCSTKSMISSSISVQTINSWNSPYFMHRP